MQKNWKYLIPNILFEKLNKKVYNTAFLILVPIPREEGRIFFKKTLKKSSDKMSRDVAYLFLQFLVCKCGVITSYFWACCGVIGMIPPLAEVCLGLIKPNIAWLFKWNGVFLTQYGNKQQNNKKEI